MKTRLGKVPKSEDLDEHTQDLVRFNWFYNIAEVMSRVDRKNHILTYNEWIHSD